MAVYSGIWCVCWLRAYVNCDRSAVVFSVLLSVTASHLGQGVRLLVVPCISEVEAYPSG